jgi:hypothetical protein
MYRLELLQQMGYRVFEHSRTGEMVWLTPSGGLIPYRPGDTFARAVLDAVGHEVTRDLTWEWPIVQPLLRKVKDA